MDDLTSLVEGIVTQLGRAFFLSGLLPALLAVAVNQYIIFAPPYSGATQVWNFFPALTSPWLGLLSGPMLTTLVLALGLALMLIVLNLFIIRLFEGLTPGMKALLYPLYARRLALHRRHYAAIAAKRAELAALRSRLEELEEEQANAELDAYYALQEEIDRLHADKEKHEPVQSLPYERKRVTPTAFGNAWAVMEEYPLARYGLDSAVFWPYIRTVLSEKNAPLLDQIDNQKLQIDIAVNLALVALILALEGLLFGALRLQWPLLLLAVIGLALFWAFYRAAVNYVLTLGVLVNQAFDLYRLPVLDAFDLARPTGLEQEYWVWSRLAAFLRRGESFYFDLLDRRNPED